MNKLIEGEAIKAVWVLYENDGWEVESKESEKCGYDLHCTKGNREEHVEVKGVRGTELSFIITKKERAYLREPYSVVCVVTNALDEPHITKMTGLQVLDGFEFSEIISYKASLRSNPRSAQS